MIKAWLDTQKRRLWDVVWLTGVAYGAIVIIAQEAGLYLKDKIGKVL